MLVSGQYMKELSEGYRLTTNNRMELMAVIKGLEALKNPGCVPAFAPRRNETDITQIQRRSQARKMLFRKEARSAAEGHDLQISEFLCHKIFPRKEGVFT